MPYENLMSPIQVRGMMLKNRVMMAPMGTNLANADGSISEEHKNYYRLRAKGGHQLCHQFRILDTDSQTP